MIIKSAQVRLYLSIEDSGLLELGPVTVLIGRNNSGKPALLPAMYLAQGGSTYQKGDRPLRAPHGPRVRPNLAEPHVPPVVTAYSATAPGPVPSDLAMSVAVDDQSSPVVSLVWDRGKSAHRIDAMTAEHPSHLFVPVFSRRKIGSYDNNVDDAKSRCVLATAHNLTAQLHSLSGHHPKGQDIAASRAACAR